jgi:hypothetical protein
MFDFYSDPSVSDARILLTGSDWRSFAIPRQYSMLSYVYNVDASGNFAPNTVERTAFQFGIDDVNTTALTPIGYSNTLGDFQPGTGTDPSLVTSVQAKGGNFSGEPAIFSLLLGWSLVPVALRQDSTVDATANKSVFFGGSTSALSTAVQSRSEQLIRQAMRSAAVIAIPDGNNPNCGARLSKVQLNPSAVGQSSESMPQVAAANGRDSRFRLREAIPYRGDNNPNINYNRLRVLFGAVPNSTVGQQFVVQKAPGDPALTENTSVVVDFALIADVALIKPELGTVRIDRGDGTFEEVQSYLGIRPQDRELIAQYMCWK